MDGMREMIGQERTPLTDPHIINRLVALGIHIARLTVARYRLSFAILRRGPR